MNQETNLSTQTLAKKVNKKIATSSFLLLALVPVPTTKRPNGLGQKFGGQDKQNEQIIRFGGSSRDHYFFTFKTFPIHKYKLEPDSFCLVFGLGRSQSDQIGRCFELLGNKFSYKNSPKILVSFRDILNKYNFHVK